MPKYRYIIAATITGDLLGTDSEEVAWDYARNSENYVCDSELGEILQWFEGDKSREPLARARDSDPTPWCLACGAMRRADCHCGPLAEND